MDTTKPKVVWESTCLGRRPLALGHPKLRWTDQISEDRSSMELNKENWQDTAENRVSWRGIVRAAQSRST